jgi:hypothetical protein
MLSPSQMVAALYTNRWTQYPRRRPIASEKDDAQADSMTLSGKAAAGLPSETIQITSAGLELFQTLCFSRRPLAGCQRLFLARSV